MTDRIPIEKESCMYLDSGTTEKKIQAFSQGMMLFVILLLNFKIKLKFIILKTADRKIIYTVYLWELPLFITKNKQEVQKSSV